MVPIRYQMISTTHRVILVRYQMIPTRYQVIPTRYQELSIEASSSVAPPSTPHVEGRRRWPCSLSSTPHVGGRRRQPRSPSFTPHVGGHHRRPRPTLQRPTQDMMLAVAASDATPHATSFAIHALHHAGACPGGCILCRP